ncbi:GtrA family protein [Sulfurimonas sp. HSL1-2]|uniref:GtrA family protein n=1 Tax=Thiomicrolovo zhangzhouensis TaxID=3131933 RepID=UPI0031FA35AE
MKQIRDFLYVGITATLVDFSLYSLLVGFDVFKYVLATVVGYSAGFFVSFFLTRKYVFSTIKMEKMHHEFLVVAAITFVGLILNILIVYGLKKVALDDYSARAIAIGIVFFFNYFARKGFVYG